MPHIKKLEIHGFKSFAHRTQLPFGEGINTIIGPNGSGKSNISDALCFVLGRLSSKSMRASKAANLIFQGSKEKKPSQEAHVEITFDNSDNIFNTGTPEVALKRSVRRNGSSIYKINNETKTRQEILEVLGQAGIDPNGFNLILQGEIARFVKMRGEDRRGIIEEIAGISIYELRKQKSLKEIEKAEVRLKEVSAVLRERTSYLKNLESERKQALKSKDLAKTIKQCKSSIIQKKISERTKNLETVNKDVEKNQKFKSRIKSEISEINSEMFKIEERITEINKYIQKTTGLERETLNEEVTMLNSRIAADQARKENFEKKLSDNELRKKELSVNISDLQEELEDLKTESPKVSKQQEEIKKKKLELEEVSEKKEKLSSLQTEISNISERIKDKQILIDRNKVDSKALFNQINTISEEITIHEILDCEKEITRLESEITGVSQKTTNLRNTRIDLEKSLSVNEAEITRNESLKTKLPDAETCPLCQSNMTKSHREYVIADADKIIKESHEKLEGVKNNLLELEKQFKNTSNETTEFTNILINRKSDLVKLQQISEKKEQMKKFMDLEKEASDELNILKNSQKNLEKNLQDKESIEERYSKLFFELQELSSRTDKNLDTTILFKENEIDSIENILRNIDKDKIILQKEIENLSTELKNNESNLIIKQKNLNELNEKFKKLFDERNEIQETVKQKNSQLSEKQNIVTRFDSAINNHKVEIARISAEKENLEFEVQEFGDLEVLSGSIDVLTEKLKKSEQVLITLGNVNMRALETYDTIKEEYDKVYTKVEQLQTERDNILTIIAEIDKKKKRTFMKTYKAINDLFTSNFSELSTKGKAFLEIENKEDVFAGGIGIGIKVGNGKYFDVSSLSGGEQTLVALSLIFSIQEYKPYAFYILDEIDASLDKRNAGLLANLLRKYIKKGQYIIISHNDEIITNADVLYGVSMNNGISKVLSLDLERGNELVKAN